VLTSTVNPFAEFAGAGLFSWIMPKDKAILLGMLPFEFRIQSDVPEFAVQNIPPAWKRVFE
jgi:hypothetical protein